jgi:hypothetical protein
MVLARVGSEADTSEPRAVLNSLDDGVGGKLVKLFPVPSWRDEVARGLPGA